MGVKSVAILGSTGSIGVSTLDVIARHPDRFRVHSLTAYHNTDRLFEQCRQFSPDVVVMVDADAALDLERKLSGVGLNTITVLSGASALEQVASAAEVDYVMAAIVGAAGLLSSLAAARAGKRVLLANKEALVMSGDLFIRTISENGATLLPIDSEHNAVFQCLSSDTDANVALTGVRRILLTGSGGPFRNLPLDKLGAVTPDQACAHPVWSMGRKISVDSATMMNKGLEIIEACWLFSVSPDQVEVVLHPQSVIHSMVDYVDGSVLAQLGNPDMRTPIAHALAWPERIDSGVDALDLPSIAHMDFSKPSFERFPCLGHAYAAIRAGGNAPTVLNAANEVAVDAFLQGRLKFTGIADTVSASLEHIELGASDSVEMILESDHRTRKFARRFIADRLIQQEQA